MLMIDFFVFNVVQAMIIERQINGICEAASLAGTSILARMDITGDDIKHSKLKKAQKAACRCAENMILSSRILNNSLNKAVSFMDEADLDKRLKPNECRYVVKLSDPRTNAYVTNLGNTEGRTVSCFMAFGYSPIFLSFADKICYPIIGEAKGGLPQIDSVLVFDLSSSMDDQTVVTFVRREWIHSPLGNGNFAAGNVSPNNMNSGGCGIIQYLSLSCPSSPHTIANYLGWDYSAGVGSHAENGESAVLDGSLVNALAPQSLDKAAYESHGAITHPMRFDAYLRSHYSHYNAKGEYSPWEAAVSPYCRAFDYGTPPGNCDLSVGLGGNGDAVTDMMGNLTTAFGPTSIPARPPGPGSTYSSFNNPPNQSPIQMVQGMPIPANNAFSDLIWQNDGSNYFGYQPAAPGATQGLAQNDPVSSPDQQTFTDLVVNITPPREQPMQGPDNFVGFSYTFPADEQDQLLRGQQFDFPNIAVVVEAARGNLEGSSVLPKGLTNAQMALIDRPVSIDGTIFDMSSVGVKNGYQKAYQRLAMLCVQPLASLLAAADQCYLERLHKFTDCRFGLVTFSNSDVFKEKSMISRFRTTGTVDEKSANTNVSSNYYIFGAPNGNPIFTNSTYDSGRLTAGGFNSVLLEDGEGMGFRLPRICLDAQNEHYLDCVSKNKLKGDELNDRLNFGAGANGIYNCRVGSVCDTAEALDTARQMFHCDSYDLSGAAKYRTSARRLIIFFMDGEPSGGVNGSQGRETLKISGRRNGNIDNDSCASNGIAVFTIGLNLTKGSAFNKLKERQLEFLGDQEPTGGQSGGIAWRASHGSRYYSCENLTELKAVFCDIARRFVQSQP